MIRRAATDDQLVRWAPECFGTPDDIKLGALAVTEPSSGSDVRSIQIPPPTFTAEEGGMVAANTEPLGQRMDAPR